MPFPVPVRMLVGPAPFTEYLPLACGDGSMYKQFQFAPAPHHITEKRLRLLAPVHIQISAIGQEPGP